VCVQVRRATFFIPSAEHFVRRAAARFGMELRSQPVFSHFLLEKALTLLPAAWSESYLMKHNMDIRQRALRYKEKMAKTAKSS
jgi:hypothetical protein